MLRDLFFVGNRLAGRGDPRLARGLFFAIAEALAAAVPYILVLAFLRRALEGRLTETSVLLLSGGVIVASLVRVVLGQPAMANIFVATHALMGRARIRVADHLRRLPMGFFTSQRSGELAGNLTTDIALVEDIWSHLLGVFAASFILPFLVGIGLAFLDWRLGLVVFMTLPAALLVLRFTTPIFVGRMGAVLEASADANARIVEYAQGIAVLRAFGRHGQGAERLRLSMERLRDALIRAEVGPSPLLSVYGFTVEASFVLVALAGSYFMLGGSLDASTLLVFLVVSAGVTRQLSELGVGLLMLRASQKALQRIDDLMAEKPLDDPAEAAQPIERFDLRVEDVSFAYDEKPILAGVSIEFPERKLTALVGRSGSGKSTLVHLVARLWDVERGRGAIRIGGVDVRDVPVEQLHRHIAMVFQDVVLFSGTVHENIAIGRADASRDEVVRAAKAAQAHDFILALPDGYDTVLGESGGTLSGGERQRLSIARAILKGAPIVLLDEATASVDATAEAEIQRAVDELVKHKTVVVIAHRLRTIRRAHQIVVLDDGKVIERGRHDELVAEGGVYARLWAEQERARGWKVTKAREGALRA